MKTFKKILSLFVFALVAFTLVSCGDSYTVSFDADNETPIVKKTVESGSKVAKPEDPQKGGYSFLGWYLEESEEPFDFDTKIEKNLTLVGRWVLVSYTVTFDAAGGSQVDEQTVPYGEKAVEPEAPTKPNGVFIGWFVDGVAYDFTAVVEKDLIIVAHWEEAYMVIYNLNYDDLTIEVSAVPGELLDPIEVVVREGYLFAGWFKNRAYTRQWDMLTEVMPEEDLMLYAKWEAIPVIKGIESFTHYVSDEEPDLMADVSAIDAFDGEVEVTLEIGDLDFEKAGVYEVTYKAKNLADRETVEVITITVVHENRLVIEKGENLPQKVYLQVSEEILGFYIEFSYEGNIAEADITVLLQGWIKDVNVEDGLIKIAATGITEVDLYLLTEILRVNKNVDLEIIKVVVDTVEEDGLIIK